MRSGFKKSKKGSLLLDLNSFDRQNGLDLGGYGVLNLQSVISPKNNKLLYDKKKKQQYSLSCLYQGKRSNLYINGADKEFEFLI